MRQIKVVADFPDVEVFGCAGGLLEVEGVDVADGSGEFDEDAVARGAARLRLARRARFEGPERLIGEGLRDTVPT